MSELSLRERLLIGVMCFLFVGFGLFLFMRQSGNKGVLLQEDLSLVQRQWKEVQKLAQEWDRVQGLAIPDVMDVPLGTFVENVARDHDISDHLQLNELSSVPEYMEGFLVRLDSLNLDQVLDVLYELENHQPVLRLQQLDISISPGSRLARISFQIFKQKREHAG